MQVIINTKRCRSYQTDWIYEHGRFWPTHSRACLSACRQVPAVLQHAAPVYTGEEERRVLPRARLRLQGNPPLYQRPADRNLQRILWVKFQEK